MSDRRLGIFLPRSHVIHSCRVLSSTAKVNGGNRDLLLGSYNGVSKLRVSRYTVFDLKYSPAHSLLKKSLFSGENPVHPLLLVFFPNPNSQWCQHLWRNIARWYNLTDATVFHSSTSSLKIWSHYYPTRRLDLWQAPVIEVPSSSTQRVWLRD